MHRRGNHWNVKRKTFVSLLEHRAALLGTGNRCSRCPLHLTRRRDELALSYLPFKEKGAGRETRLLDELEREMGNTRRETPCTHVDSRRREPSKNNHKEAGEAMKSHIGGIRCEAS